MLSLRCPIIGVEPTISNPVLNRWQFFCLYFPAMSQPMVIWAQDREFRMIVRIAAPSAVYMVDIADIFIPTAYKAVQTKSLYNFYPRPSAHLEQVIWYSTFSCFLPEPQRSFLWMLVVVLTNPSRNTSINLFSSLGGQRRSKFVGMPRSAGTTTVFCAVVQRDEYFVAVQATLLNRCCPWHCSLRHIIQRK
jgi:hypothetical protein